ncbi:hypothetical protein tb265_25140 [Gemmatimonadetes bacterium T265]|nr:hypothetical protein tb265_25140 [Gemmatimonadetes bacterium T265]
MTPRPEIIPRPSAALATRLTDRPDVGALLADDAVVDAAVAAAQHDAVRTHGLLGRPVVVWRDGRVVEELLQPEPESSDAPTGPTPTDMPRP